MPGYNTHKAFSIPSISCSAIFIVFRGTSVTVKTYRCNNINITPRKKKEFRENEFIKPQIMLELDYYLWHHAEFRFAATFIVKAREGCVRKHIYS